MQAKKTIERVSDIKNSQAHVKYTDGSYGFTLTNWVPEALRRQYYEERANEIANYRAR